MSPDSNAGYPADATPRLYGTLAGWFHLVTRPEDYEEEADYFLELLRKRAARAPASCWSSGAEAETTPSTSSGTSP